MARVAPFALLVDPQGAAGRLRQGLPGRIDIEEVAAEDSLAPAEAVDLSQHPLGEGRRVFAGGHMEAVALHRAHRAHADELGVIAQAELAGELGEGLVEDELPVAVALEVQGGQGHQPPLAPEPQVAGLPALAGHDAAAGLQVVQPSPAVEGAIHRLGRSLPGAPHQGLPLVFRDLLCGLMPADLQLGHGRWQRRGRGQAQN